jgi:outer membrane lipoprotein-sorting protein
MSAMRIMVLLLAVLALVGLAALGFVFYELFQQPPVEQMQAP